MMRIDILTLFPEMFLPLGESMMKRAVQKGLAHFQITNIRDYAKPPHWMVDDLVYGGGAGMVMKPEPILAALEALGYRPGDTVVLPSPAGKPFNQQTALRLSREERLFILCGHYEGIDQRVADFTRAEEISIGDYVLTGGELPAMVLVDATVRLLPGVLGDSASSTKNPSPPGFWSIRNIRGPPVFAALTCPKFSLAATIGGSKPGAKNKPLQEPGPIGRICWKSFPPGLCPPDGGGGPAAHRRVSGTGALSGFGSER